MSKTWQFCGNFNCNHHYTTQHSTTLQLQLQQHDITLHYTRLHHTNYNYSYNYAALHHTTLHNPTLHYTTLITPLQMQLQVRYTNYTTPQLQLHYTTTSSSSCGWGDDQVTTATIAATPKNTTPTTFRCISGLALPSGIHNNQPLL